MQLFHTLNVNPTGHAASAPPSDHIVNPPIALLNQADALDTSTVANEHKKRQRGDA